MLKRLVVAVLLLGALLGALFGWKLHLIRQAALAAAPPPPPLVAVTEVRQETWQPALSAVGSLVAVAGVAVTSEVAGKVGAIHFESGQEVQAGQPLVDLDADTDRAELDGLLAAQRLAQVKFTRQASLLAKNSAAQADYDEAKAVLDAAAAAVHAKHAVIDKKQIRAPFGGRLGIRQVDLGQYLAPGSPIVTLQALNPIYADFALPERQLERLGVGQAVVVAVQAYPGERFQGRITALEPGVEAGTRSVGVRAVLDNPQQRLRPGMFAEVQVLLPEGPPLLTLPRTAVTYAPYGDSVFTVEAGEGGPTVQRRQVETGEVRGDRVAILSGLSAGQRVVSAGQVKLRNGMPVALDDRPAPGERGGAP
jgi:membrane fusion protein (multidrug efflux system)